jgi:hypothetical protein
MNKSSAPDITSEVKAFSISSFLISLSAIKGPVPSVSTLVALTKVFKCSAEYLYFKKALSTFSCILPLKEPFFNPSFNSSFVRSVVAVSL